MAKKIYVGGRIENREVGGIVTGAAEVFDDAKGKKQSVINQETDTELERLDQSKQDNLTFDNAPTEGSNNPVKSGGVYTNEALLRASIEAILLLIPSAATELNKLADKAFVNSSIATSTATFRGTFTDLQELLAAPGDANDYAYLQTTDASGNSVFDRYKYVDGTGWVYEYKLNNNAFTAEEWAAIRSGITAALVTKLTGLPTSSELQVLLGQKQDVLTFDNIPVSGSVNPVKSGGVYSAINEEKTARENLEQTVTDIDGRVGDVEEVIPTGADANNKLVANNSMEAYVASIIDAITASFTIATADGHINLTLTQTNGRVASLTLTSSDIASAQALTALTGRVSTAEGNITTINSDITSLGGRVSTSETDIANLQQLYNNLQQSKPVPVTALPETGQQQGVIYRLAGTTSYSDYMWNGSTWVLMATYNNAIDPLPKKASQNLVTSGGVFDNMGALDVSELNATENPHTLAQYVDLSAALAAIPTDYQKGGMSIKFVQSSDNKYVQFRYMGTSTANADFANVANWQGGDNEPTAGSDNLANGKGTYYAINKSNSKIGQLVNINRLNGRINTGGTIGEATSSVSFTDVFNVSDYRNKDIIVITNFISSSYATYAFLTDLNNWSNGLTPNYCSGTSVQIFYHNQNTITVPSDAVYLVVTGFHTYSNVQYDHNVNVLLKDGMLQVLKTKEDELISKTQQLEFVKRANECIYDSWLGSSGAISLNTSTFITPLIPLTSPSITIKNNGTPSSANILFYSSDKTTISDWYTIGSEQTRLITGLDLNTHKYCRMTFAQNDKECYIYDNTNNNYLWYGYYDFYKALKDENSELSSKADIPIVCLGGGSRLSWDSEAYTITFPAGSYVLYQNIRYSFLNPVTLSIPHNNGFVIFNPQNVATNNGVKNANANYVFTKGDRVLFTYSNLYRFISLPNGLYNITDEYIGDYANTIVSIRDRIVAAKTVNRVANSIPPLLLSWFSDVHGQGSRISEMQRFINNYVGGFSNLIDDVISTGDEVSQYYTDDFTYWANVGANNYLQAVGNHECRDSQTRLDTYTAAQVYEKFFAPYISRWNVQSAGVNLCYYYKDYAAQKIRLIVLDCMHYDENQNNWLIATLSSAKTSGLSVIIANHFRADVPDYIQNPFTSLITGDGGTLDIRVCEAVQDFIGVDHSGKFICHIAGHTHYDVVYTCHNYPEQLGIIIGCMTTSGADNEHQARVGRFRNLFNFIAFDTDSKLIKIIRPCCNMDRWNRAQNTLVVNYETRNVIYND